MSDLLRLCTAGSVDDGKSTLVGRLLYESRAVYEDQIHAVSRATRQGGADAIDFSLFTDGLRAEREQGITIDVAYRYFATSRRKFILADTPGHEQYTRNMATGASTADLAMLLVDVQQGVREQTRRHARIARLLGITSFVLAVNKMDLVGFDRDTFDAVCREFADLAGDALVRAIPLSALCGDNVIARSQRTPWYDGPSLLEHLETAEIAADRPQGGFRFPVQIVLRSDGGFRGYAGQVVSGSIHPGDEVTVWPSGIRTRVRRITTWDGDAAVAFAPMSVALEVDADVDIGRGDLLSTGAVHVSRRFTAEVVWMDERPLDPRRPYLLKHTSRTVTADVEGRLELNEIGSVTLTTSRPLAFDPYARNRATGSFVLIDPATGFTSAAGMIVRPETEQAAPTFSTGAAGRIALAARAAHSDGEAIDAVRRALEEILT